MGLKSETDTTLEMSSDMDIRFFMTSDTDFDSDMGKGKFMTGWDQFEWKLGSSGRIEKVRVKIGKSESKLGSSSQN